jgi:hypothetical protein
MFLRVLGAMVVADALDRRARRRELRRHDRPPRPRDERAGGGASRPEESVGGRDRQLRVWDRRAPERVV